MSQVFFGKDYWHNSIDTQNYIDCTLLRHFRLHALKDFNIICLSNPLSVSVLDEGCSRNRTVY
jgi:hypothetical protein